MAEGRVRGFSIATKCATVDELIEKFRDRVDEHSLLVTTTEPREIGTEFAFALLLEDKRVALAGTCTVMDVFSDGNNPFKRPGMRLAIERLGPASERVWAELVARRISPRRMTTVVPVIPIPRTKSAALAPRTSTLAIPTLAPSRTRTMTRGSGVAAAVAPVRDTPRRLQTVQIPPARDSQRALDSSGSLLDEPLVRAPRGTPPSLEGQQCALATAPPVVETRTPGSSLILPANPLMNLTDASLQGFVDCKLGEAIGTPEAFPLGTNDELETVEPSEPMLAAASSEPIAKRPSDLAIPAYVEPVRSEPWPLPPPPLQSPRPSMRTPRPLALQRSTELPRLPVVSIDDGRANAHVPLLSRRARIFLALAFAIAPVVGAASVIGYMQLTAMPAITAPARTPAPLATADALRVQGTVAVETPPPEPPPEEIVEVPPARPQPIHAVLVQTYPIAARVTVGNRFFGTTPTYVKIPANTPVDVRIERPGFTPVTYPLVSKARYDRVFLRLKPAPKKGKR
jgi:hypothetical protein